jgi:glycosyltransferase involved in cell wall biosynthesis
MTSYPDVSVVIPTHNRVHYLEKTIASCFRHNSSLTVEVIVVNDGSSDGTREYLDSLTDPHVHPIHQESQGAQVARNQGLRAAHGKCIKFLDDDDWLTPGGLAAEVGRLETSGADVVHGKLQIREEREGKSTASRIAPESIGEDPAATVLRESMVTIPHKYLFRHEALQQHTWDPSLPYHQDYAFLIDVACSGAQFVSVDHVVGVRRSHEGPRIATIKTAAPRQEYYTLKVELIKRGLRRLKENHLLEDHHRLAAAEGIWNWAHIVAGFDLGAFERFCDEIETIAPNFTPERSHRLYGALDTLLGVRGTERALYPLRCAKNVFAQ